MTPPTPISEAATPSRDLSIYDNAKHWVAQYESVDEVKEYIDKAAALEEYARRANDWHMEHQVARARVRAERRCGELLAVTEKSKPGPQPIDRSSHTTDLLDKPKTLKEIGLSKDQSSQYQQLAKVPEKEFEDRLNNAATKPTTRGILASRKPPEPVPQINEDALELWGELCDFENGLMKLDINFLVAEMVPATRPDAERIIPKLIKWLQTYDPKQSH